MLFVVDIGNTNIVAGLFSGSSLFSSWRMGTDCLKTADEYEAIIRSFLSHRGISPEAVEGAVISSVVPALTGVFEDLSASLFKRVPLVVGPGVKTGMPIKMDNPKEVGADRIANGVAAFELYGGPVIVADFGTATTYDVVSEKGEYIGGMISPGINISMEALFERAAKLPRVAFEKPGSVIGKNTVSCMQAGIMCQVIGGIEYSVRAIKKELGARAFVAATGGLAEVVAPWTDVFDAVNGSLTLEGLRIIYYRNV